MDDFGSPHKQQSLCCPREQLGESQSPANRFITTLFRKKGLFFIETDNQIQNIREVNHKSYESGTFQAFRSDTCAIVSAPLQTTHGLFTDRLMQIAHKNGKSSDKTACSNLIGWPHAI